VNSELRLLLIEDSEDDAMLLLNALERGGVRPVALRVETAEAMREALNRQEWDVVISDYFMPRFSGPDALALLKEKGLDLPFLIVSGAVEEETAVLAMRAGAHDYIMKDNLARLVPVIERERREAEVRKSQKRIEEEKRKIESQLFQSRKMEAIGRLTGGVAHDFNNILTAIRGYTDLAIRHAEPGSSLFGDLTEVQSAVDRAAGLTRQLLLFSRCQPMEFEPVDVNQSIRNLLGMLRRILGEDVRVVYELSPEPLVVLADPTSVEQMLMNLVVNGRDAMPDGGTIRIRTEPVSLRSADVRSMPDGRPGRFVRLSVSDTGSGMDASVLEHIFEPFFTTKDIGMGSGLGLSVVYGIIQQHKGWILVDSRPGGGSDFHAYLPRSDAHPKSHAPDGPVPEAFKGRGERILLIEDEESVRVFSQRSLEDNGYRVYAASGEKEAMDLFTAQQGDFHLIFSDVVLPNTTGIKLIEKMTSLNPGLRVLFSSGYTDTKSQWEIIKEKGYPFLQKPYSLNHLLTTVHEALKKKRSS
jgi:two-component system, cell cycle sensor histidine kinase and response regulator CckA